jgi:hypothetical protein
VCSSDLAESSRIDSASRKVFMASLFGLEQSTTKAI